MRIISKKILLNFWEKWPETEEQIKAWHEEIKSKNWKNPNELKIDFGNASIITGKRVVFNIHGNKYRLIADIEYNLGIVFIVWIGTHKEYEKLNVKEVKYVQTDKK